MLPVYLRVRPSESTRDAAWLDIIDTTTVRNGDQQHTFKHVFGSSSQQVEVYEKCVQPLVSKVLQGQDQCFFTLGATGSGKTWTTVGSPGDFGVVYRAVQQVFETCGDDPVRLAMMEIYNDRVYDLLNDRRNLSIRTTSGSHRCEVNATRVIADDFDSAVALMEEGYRDRAVFATQCNSQSSRSHVIVFIEVGDTRLTVGDLAGNERVNEAKSTGTQLKEAGEINKSLMVFGQALMALQLGRLSLKGSKLSSLLLVNAERDMPVMLVTMDARRNQKPGEQVLRYATIAKKVKKVKSAGSATSTVSSDLEARLRAEMYADTEARLLRVYETLWEVV